MALLNNQLKSILVASRIPAILSIPAAETILSYFILQEGQTLNNVAKLLVHPFRPSDLDMAVLPVMISAVVFMVFLEISLNLITNLKKFII